MNQMYSYDFNNIYTANMKEDFKKINDRIT